MDYFKFKKALAPLLAADLPDFQVLLKDGRSMANGIKLGRTAFMEKMGVSSEAEYKRQCKKQNKIMYHTHIGMNTWEATAVALAHIYQAAESAGYCIDRAGICLDRRMGLPQEARNKVPSETGPLLLSNAEWNAVGTTVPIQPHMGDFMIGFPAAVGNTINALRAGVTTIGNLSQYFAHAVPGWKDNKKTTAETVKALVIMSSLRSQGAVIHSYLEDGFGAHFHDCATIAGWAYLERYIVEELLGGKLAHCIGGLTSDPLKRVGWVFALDEIHSRESIGSMIYGDTISFTPDPAFNQGIVAEYLLWDIIAQFACPTGHAVLPLPKTEAVRVPSEQEIVEAQSFGHRIEKAAARLFPLVDLREARSFSSRITTLGKQVFKQALAGLQDEGVDSKDPVRMLYVLKSLGPKVFEARFGLGEIDTLVPNGRKPLVPTDVYEFSTGLHKTLKQDINQRGLMKIMQGRRFLIASTDVHEFAVGLIDRLLSEAGAYMINLGAEKNPDEVVKAAFEFNVDGILISTHNGMALEYAQRLRKELGQRGSDIPVLMGGVLNQKVKKSILPVDVSQSIQELGFYASQRLQDGLTQLMFPISESGKED